MSFISLQDFAFIIIAVLTVAIVLAFIRLVKGPSLPDRVVALDLMTTLSIAFVAAYAIATDQAIFIDVASVVALISFLGTIAFAYYIEKRA